MITTDFVAKNQVFYPLNNEQQRTYAPVQTACSDTTKVLVLMLQDTCTDLQTACSATTSDL